VLGPMVYAAAFCEAGDEAAMAKMCVPILMACLRRTVHPWRTQASVKI